MNNQFSQRVSDIITYSKEEANRLKNRYIGPEHLLLGMLRDGGGKAIEILQKLDIDLNRVKKRLEGFLKEIEDDNLLPDAVLSVCTQLQLPWNTLSVHIHRHLPDGRYG